MVVSPGFKCLPSGLHFKKPVKLIMPHCAVLHDPGRVKTVLHSWSHEIAGKIERIPQTPSTCKVHHSHFELMLEHFSVRWLTMIWDWVTGKGKWMCCMPYLPNTMPASRKPLMELRLQNKPNQALKYTRGHLYQPALDEDYQIMIERKDLKITCDRAQEDHGTEILQYSHIFSTDRCKVAFILDLQSNQENTAVTLKLIQNNTYKIMFDTGCIVYSFQSDVEDKGLQASSCSDSLPTQSSHSQSPETLGTTDSSGQSTDQMPMNRQTFSDPTTEVDGTQSTVDASEVTDKHLVSLSRELLPRHFSALYVALGIPAGTAESIRVEKMNNYPETYMQLLQLWKAGSKRTLADLDRVLVEANASGLISKYKLHI